MKFLIKTASLLSLTLFLTTTLSAQSFLDWSDYPENACNGQSSLTITQTDYNGSPALLVTATLEQPAIVNVIAPANGHTSNSTSWSYGNHNAMVGYGEGIGYGNTPEVDEVSCYFYFADGSSCKNVCTVEIDF